jgi:hypothetical protein
MRTPGISSGWTGAAPRATLGSEQKSAIAMPPNAMFQDAAALLGAIAGTSGGAGHRFVVYVNHLKNPKTRVLPALIQHHGAVSEMVACAMAEGTLAGSHAAITVAITGMIRPAP